MWDGLVRPIRDHLPLWLLLLPILGMMLLPIARSLSSRAVQWTMRVVLGMSVVLSVCLVVAYEPLKLSSLAAHRAGFGPLERFQFRDSFGWVGESRTALLERTRNDGTQQVIEVPIRWGPDICIEVGVDGISLWFVALSVLLVGVGSGEWSVGSGKPNTAHSGLPNPGTPLAWLWLQASLVGTFVALDVVLFAMSWMSTWLAVAWLMGRGGDSQRHAVTPSLLQRSCWSGWMVLLGLGGLVLVCGWLRPVANRPETPLIFAIPELVAGVSRGAMSGESALLWASVSTWLFWLLVIGFTGPLWLVPFHQGFVSGFESAPRGVSMVLAGVLLKVGVFGWLRFILPLFPELLRQYADSFTTLFGWSSLFAALLAFGATDWRRRIALATCSSISLSLLGISTLTQEGLTGGLLRLFSHGLTAGLLLWLLPREEPATAGSNCAGSNEVTQRWRVGLVRFSLFAWIGLPGLSGFVAEFVTPFGLFQHEFNAAALSFATSGVIAWMWVRSEREPLNWSGDGWSHRQTIIAAVLVALNLGMGVAPQVVVDRVQPSLMQLLPGDRVTTAVFLETQPLAEVR